MHRMRIFFHEFLLEMNVANAYKILLRDLPPLTSKFRDLFENENKAVFPLNTLQMTTQRNAVMRYSQIISSKMVYLDKTMLLSEIQSRKEQENGETR